MNFWFICLLILSLAGVSQSNAQDSQELTQTPKKFIKQKKTQNDKPILVGAELRYYQYSEPELALTHTGLLYGAWGEWNWTSAIGDGKLYGNFLYGVIDYDGALCNKLNVCTPHQAKTTDMISKINTRLFFSVTPEFKGFAGLGYRYLYDLGQGTGFYTRTGNWLYLPLGAELNFEKFKFEIEYDLIGYGTIMSNLSEASSTYQDLTLNQKGYGLLLSASYDFSSDWSIKGLYELWFLDTSNSMTSGGKTFYEPQNSSQSISVGVGYKM